MAHTTDTANEIEVRTVPIHFYKAGDPVWYHYQRSRWTSELNIPAFFVKSNPKAATVDIINADGTKRRQHIKWSKISFRTEEGLQAK